MAYSTGYIWQQISLLFTISRSEMFSWIHENDRPYVSQVNTEACHGAM